MRASRRAARDYISEGAQHEGCGQHEGEAIDRKADRVRRPDMVAGRPIHPTRAFIAPNMPITASAVTAAARRGSAVSPRCYAHIASGVTTSVGLHTRAEGSIETDRQCVAALLP